MLPRSLCQTLRHLVPAIGVALALALLPVIVASCSGKNTGNTGGNNTPITQPTPTVTGVSVSGAAPQVGLTSQFSATATMSNGTSQVVTSQATWQSSNTTVATVAAGGLVTGRAAGSADITATYQNVNGSSRINVPQQVVQPPTTFTVSGAVTDGTSGGVLPGIAVRVTSGANNGKSATTDGSGRYTMTNMSTGSMTVSASATSYTTVDKSVTVSANMTVDFVLPRVAAPPQPPQPPNPPTPIGAFVDVQTEAKTCGCSKGTIRVTANGISIGTTTCAPATRRMSVNPGANTLRACDDLGCWQDRQTTFGTNEVVTWLLTCTGPTATLKTTGRE